MLKVLISIKTPLEYLIMNWDKFRNKEWLPYGKYMLVYIYAVHENIAAV